MKKIAVFLLTLSVMAALTACGQGKPAAPTATDSIAAESIAESVAATNALQESSMAESGQTVEMQTEITESASGENSQTSDNNTANSGNRVLVAYFSATHTTEGVAEKNADGLSADLYEIVPEQPYTDADLNYNDNNSRSTLEMADASVRPAIAGSVENMDQYDVVFIGA